MTRRTRPSPNSRVRALRTVVKPLPLLIGLAFAQGGAWAQAAAPAPAASTPAGTLQAVTVTAERVTEDVKNVPISVSTLGGETLDVLNSSGEDIRAL